MTGQSQGDFSKIKVTRLHLKNQANMMWVVPARFNQQVLFNKILETSFVSTLTQLSSFWEGNTISVSLKQDTSSFETRWLSLRELLKWLLRWPETIERKINERKPSWIIGEKSWVLFLLYIFAIVVTWDVAFKWLQQADIIEAEQELELKRVLLELM